MCSVMDDQARRLKRSRTRAGYRSAAAFAADHDFAESTYRAHENGSRSLTIDAAKAYAGPLGVSWHWLMFGDDVKPGSHMSKPTEGKEDTNSNVYRIRELDVRAGAGNSAYHDVAEAENVVSEWQLPATIIKNQTTTTEASLKVITIYGDSMEPDFRPGDRVMVDISDRTPSPPGVFVIWDGFGLVVKRLEMVPYSDPAKVRLISRNKEYKDVELFAEEVFVNGRVIGRWQWT